MTMQGYRHRIIIRDKSLSISSIEEGQQEGFEEFLDSEAKLPGRLTVSLWEFDSTARCVHTFVPAETARTHRLHPFGSTALFDAVGLALRNEGGVLAAMPENQRPEDVTLVISTDGQENCSHMFRGPDIAEQLKHQQDAYQWRVLFMGCGMDVFSQAGSIGARSYATMDYSGTNEGSRGAWRGSSRLLRDHPVSYGEAVASTYSAADIALANPGSMPEPEKDSPSGADSGE